MAKSSSNTKVTNREMIYCTGCDHDKKPSDFYKSYGANKSGVLPYCKQCCINMSLNNDGTFNVDKFKNMLSKVDRPFLYQTLADNLKKYPEKIESAIGFYFKDLGMVQNRSLKFKDSLFTPEENNEKDDFLFEQQSLLDTRERRRLIDKYGLGYTDEELYSFERKYDLLKENYPQKTAMHTEALLTYIRYRVKEELATAKGDVSEAQKWGNLS